MPHQEILFPEREGHFVISVRVKTLEKATCNLSQKQQMFMPLGNGKKVITEGMFDTEAPWQGVDSATKYPYRHPALAVRVSRYGATWAYTLDILVLVYSKMLHV